MPLEHSVRRPGGWMQIVGADGSVMEADTVSCCHCGNAFVIVPGSGRLRGFCTLCSGMTCGHSDCMAHYPFEARLSDYEKGKINKL